MQHILRAAAIVAVFLAATPAAQAQGFLKRLVDSAASQAESHAAQKVRRGVDGAVDGTSRRNRRGADAAPDAEPAAPASAPESDDVAVGGTPADAAPAPAATRSVRYVGDMRPPADAQGQKDAFRKFGEVSCNDCEGGIDFDSRVKFPFDEFSGKYNEIPRRIGSWSIGHVHRWQGKNNNGTMTLLGEETLQGLRCRRVEYRLVRAKGGASASRQSLVCWGMASSESSTENWHEVY